MCHRFLIIFCSLILTPLVCVAAEPVNPKVQACTQAANYAWPNFLMDKIEARQLFNEENCIIKSPTGKLLTEEELTKLRKISFDKCMAFTDDKQVNTALEYTKTQFYCVSQAIDVQRENCKELSKLKLPKDLLKAAELRSQKSDCSIKSPKGVPLNEAQLMELRKASFDECLAWKDDNKISDALTEAKKQFGCATDNDPNRPAI